MAFSTFNSVKMSGLSTVVPAEEISLKDELEYFGGDARRAERVTKMVGLDKRRVAPSGLTASDLCIEAAEDLLTALKYDRAAIEALIFVTQTPDRISPATAFTQHKKLELPSGCAVFDINMACSAYIYGLWVACSLLESRAVSRVLLLVGDTVGQWAMANSANRVLAPLFGDSGTATIMEYDPNAEPITFSIGSDGRGDEIMQMPGGGMRLPDLAADPEAEEYYRDVLDDNNNPWRVGGLGNNWMEPMKVFNFTMEVVPPLIKGHMEKVGLTEADIDWLVLHQANKQIVQNVAEKSGFPPEKAPWQTIPKFANQTAASIPGVICDQLKAELDTGRRMRLMMSGFGSGLSWGTCIMTLDGTVCTGIRDYIPRKPLPTRKELIAYWHKKMRGV